VRRERVELPLWMLGVLGLFAASGFAVAREFGGEEERFALAAIAAGNPAFLFLRGLPDGSSVGALVFFQTFAFLAVLVALMNTFLVVRHTRADEERGRSELTAATPIARAAELGTTLGIAVVANAVVAAAAFGLGLALEFGWTAALLTGLAIGAVGVAFAGVAALVAQLMPSPRGANGLAAALVGLAYLVRGVGDALGTATDPTHVEASWISWLSPIGWAQASAPFSAADPLPLLALVGLGVATAGAALLIRSRRDLGESLVPERLGRAHWRGAGSTGLAVRLQRGTIIGWAIGAAVLGTFAGALSPVVAAAVESNEQLAALIARLAPGLAIDTRSVFAIALLGIAGTLATAAAVQSIIRMRVDETEDRAELLLVTGLSRTGWLVRQCLVAVTSMLLVAAVAGLAAGLGFVVSGSGADRIPTSLAAVAVHLPAGLTFVAATALAFAFVPRLTVTVGWGLLVLGLIVGQLGELIGLPEQVQALSPLHHVPAVPIEEVEPWSILLFAAIGVVGFALAGLGLRRRDVPA
jgi:ABC-2 type transport system permease protein